MTMVGLVSQEDIALLHDSELFNASWYLERYPDVALTGIDPAEHYIWLGVRLGRNPSLEFDGNAYLANNPDVAKAEQNPLLHYLKDGAREGRWIVETREKLTETLTRDLPIASSGAKPTLNWVMNPDNVGWAYGNNARMLARQMPEFDHVIDGHDIVTDVALYFDIKIFKMRGSTARRNILRVGGPRPIALTYGDDTDALAADLAAFDGVIVLNEALFDRLSPLHDNVRLIPNAVDLREWRPLQRPRPDRPFTVGFAGNLSTTKEAKLKGFSFVQEACKQLDLPLVHFGKGAGQIAREDMREDFYGAIDCMVHPVGPGKEGCSNVVMEALSMGVPVITTDAAGFHAERVKDGEGILYTVRDKGKIAAAIARLRDDPDLQARMRKGGVSFATRHHDVTRTGQNYLRMLALPTMLQDKPKVVFVPFSQPAANFASSRLRCVQPAELLDDSPIMTPSSGAFDATADVVIVSQLASDATMQALLAHPEIPLIYDLCDRYFEDERVVGGVQAKSRFFELAQRASVIVTSTIKLKQAVIGLGLKTPVVYVPDGIDYRDTRDASPTPAAGSVVWYGNPGRGNFESSRWMIDHIRASGRDVQLISRKRTFQHIASTEDPTYAKYVDICTDWAFDTFVADLRKSSVCVLSHSEDEQSKSPNRLITAIANGVPVIVNNAPSCASLLWAEGLEYAVVETPEALDAALKRLDDPSERADYLAKMQSAVEAKFGDDAIKAKYESLISDNIPRKPAAHLGKGLRVMFVSHNLNVGEGAPTSLMQTVLGLQKLYGIKPTVFAVMDGGLRERYEAQGIEVIVPQLGITSRLASKIIDRAYGEMADAFREALDVCQIDVTVANTATSLWFTSLSESAGVPAITMIRESSRDHVTFDFGPEPVMETCQSGLNQGQSTVFVSGHTRDLWTDAHDISNALLIPNGINLTDFKGSPVADKTPLREALGLPQDKFVLLSVGTINGRKAQGEIVDAVAALPLSMQTEIELVLVGAKPSAYVDALKAKLADLPVPLNTAVRIVGETDVIGDWYRAADIFVFASHNESYPRVIVEAMSFGLPIISSAVFGTKEQIVDGESGLLFDPGDVAAMSVNIQRVLKDDHLRSFLSQQARSRFWELTSFEEMVRRYYVSILNVAPTRRT